MAGTQFNFELPENEANRVLDVGVARRMGLTRETVSKAMVARALILERLDQIAPVDAAPADAEFMGKVSVAVTAKPALKAKIDKLIAEGRREKRKAA